MLTELAGPTGPFRDPHVFIGGDEVDTACWEENSDIGDWLAKRGMNVTELQGYHESTLSGWLRKGGPGVAKHVIAWQEAFSRAVDPVATLGTDALVDVWLGSNDDAPFDRATMLAVTGSGLGALVSACWYLDGLHKETARGREWINYYQCDPQDFNGTDAQHKRVRGGHACIWGEATDATNLLPRIWPRLAAVAERLWSPRERANDAVDFGGRLHAHRCRLLERGIAASPVGAVSDPAVPSNLTIGPGSRSFCEADLRFSYQAP